MLNWISSDFLVLWLRYLLILRWLLCFFRWLRILFLSFWFRLLRGTVLFLCLCFWRLKNRWFNVVRFWLFFQLLVWWLFGLFIHSLRMLSCSVVLYEKLSNNLVGIKSIHTFLKLSILVNNHLWIWSDSHWSTKIVILWVTINLINFDWPRRLWIYIINDVLEIAAISTPGSKKL